MRINDGGDRFDRPGASGRFKKGESGNRRGRPRGARSFRSVVMEQMKRRFALPVNGERVWMTGREAIALVLANRAVMGDLRALQILLRFECIEPMKKPLIIIFDDGDQTI